MDHCRYCHGIASPGTRTCTDCEDYEMAARIACRVLDACDVAGGTLAASIGAEITREVLLRRREANQPSASFHHRWPDRAA